MEQLSVFAKDLSESIQIFYLHGQILLKNIFNYYKFSKIFSLGYPSDHYFDFFRRKKENEKKNFTIGYLDNIFAHDLQYDISHNNLICNMLIEILEKYPNTILYLKPKSKKLYDKYYNFKKLKS